MVQTLIPLNVKRPVADTLYQMRRVILLRRADENVRGQALDIVRGANPQDDRTRIRRVGAWVKDAVTFERDPREVEAITDPILTLERVHAYGSVAGDCDDAAVLISVLLESIGIKTRLVAVSIRKDRVLHHVAVEAYDRIAGAWSYVDPFAPSEIGDNPRFTNALKVLI